MCTYVPKIHAHIHIQRQSGSLIYCGELVYDITEAEKSPLSTSWRLPKAADAIPDRL